MSTLLGLLTAAIFAAAAWLVAGAPLQDLSGNSATIAMLALIGAALITGFLTGTTVCRRALHSRQHLGLFSALTGGFGGAMLGAATALVLTGAYESRYLTWPSGLLDQALVVLSYPSFGALGFCLGAVGGLCLGLVLGGVLRIVTLPLR